MLGVEINTPSRHVVIGTTAHKPPLRAHYYSVMMHRVIVLE